MEVGKLDVEYRGETGKSAVRRLRHAGKIPAICYGVGKEPLALSLDPVALMRSLDPVKKTNTVLTLTVANGPAGGDGELTVMLREFQRDALRGDLTHADFQRVDLTKPVHATVPVLLVGKSEGVKLGGLLHQVLRSLEVACTPDKIPAKLEVDVTKLLVGEAIHVRDLQLGEGVRPLAEPGSTVCSVTAPRVEKETTAAEGAAEAAPAEGDKKAAEGDKKGAAPAAAKEGDKKGAAPAKEGGKK